MPKGVYAHKPHTLETRAKMSAGRMGHPVSDEARAALTAGRALGGWRKGNQTGVTHGQSSTPAYRSWRAMKTRCLNTQTVHYSDYGGRGITVCDRWRDSFEAFLADMGERPDGMSLDRIDVNGNYEPENCRWATPKVQRLNSRPFATCPNGHPYTPDNTQRRRVQSNPRQCVVCETARRARYRAALVIDKGPR